MKTLEEQVALGFKATSAYNIYFKELFASELEVLKNAIINAEDIEEIIAIKHKIKAIISIEERIKTDIDTGHMAEISLTKGKN